MLFGAAAVTAQPLSKNHHEVKYVIMMVPDGMGLANVTAARILRNCGNLATDTPFRFCAEGLSGPPLYLETLEHIGYQRTYSKVNTITDSSAAASAFACGEKFVNNEVCFHADGALHNDSVLELAQLKGMATGLVATQNITHATPAAFASHLANRNCETEIARQYIQETRPNVLLGGGQATFNNLLSTPDVCGAKGDYITQAKMTGYTYVDTKVAMNDAATKANRLLGLFAAKNLKPEYQRSAGMTEPRLPEMTSAALKVLDRSKSGFFLMVEGSLIDSGDHDENLQYMYGEMKAFDEAVKVVLDWINARPERQQHTLLIILADHETGGFAVKGVGEKGGENPGQGGVLGEFQAGWTFELIPGTVDRESHHTGVDVMIYSQGPGSEALGRAVDNTFVYQVVKNALKF
jgi:alkaline phosphatase